MKTVQRKTRSADLKEQHFLEALARRCPEDVEILKALGNQYTKTGHYTEGLNTDLILSRLCPNEPLVWYNLACSFALLNRKEDALVSLERAVDLGYRNAAWIRTDADLSSLHKDHRFNALLQRLA